MADKKITELSSVSTLPDDAVFTAVDSTRSAGDQNVQISKADLAADIGGGITEITNNVITFKTLKSWVNSTLSSLTVDLTGSVEGARTVTKFNSSIDPDFTGLSSGIDYVNGSWVADTDLLLQFEYFNGDVYLVISELSSYVPPILPSNYEMFLDGNDISSLTIDGSNTVSEWRDQSANNNDFIAPTVASQPFYKRVGGLLFDDVDDRLDLDKASASYTSNTQGEVMLLCAQRDQDNLTPVFALIDNSNDQNHIYFGYQGSGGSVAGAMCYNNQKGSGGSGNRDQVIENAPYEKYQNLKYTIWNIVSDGSTITMYKNGDAITVQTVAGTNSGVWFGDKTITSGKFTLASLNSINRDPEIASVLVYDAPLTTQEREEAVRDLKVRFFGMEEPLGLNDQTLTPTTEYTNSHYNWTGGQSKNPVNNKIASVWDKGTTHYTVGDNHDVVGQISIDNGLTYSSEFTVVAGSGNFSYTNPSIGYGSDGRLLCIYTKVEFVSSVYTPQGLFFKYSDDDGATWSTEAQVSGIGANPNMNSNSVIIEGNDGNLYTTSYDADFSTTNAANVRFLESTDNGVTWGIKSNIITEPNASAQAVNETSLSLLADDTWLCLTRVQARNYYTQSISTDNGATWTDQGNTNLCDWWTDATTGTASSSVNLVRTATFEVDSVKCVAYFYLNRGVNFNTSNPTYYRIGIARAQDIIDYGVDGWQDSCSINMLVNGVSLQNVDGYGDIQFFDGDNTAFIRGFYDTSPVKWTVNPAATVTTTVQYFKYEIDENWIKAILNI